MQTRHLAQPYCSAALNDDLYACLDVATHDWTRPGREDRDAELDASRTHLTEVVAEVEMLAPELVRRAISDAVDGLDDLDDLLRATITFGTAKPDSGPSFEGAERACHLALEAMRADLGVDPIGEGPGRVTAAA